MGRVRRQTFGMGIPPASIVRRTRRSTVEPTVWRFLLFLGTELLFIVAMLAAAFSLGLLILKSRSLKNGYVITTALLVDFVSTLFLFMFVWILTGKNYLWLFAVLALASM